MLQARLNAVALCNIHQDLLDGISIAIEKVAKDFASRLLPKFDDASLATGQIKGSKAKGNWHRIKGRFLSEVYVTLLMPNNFQSSVLYCGPHTFKDP